MTSRTLLLGFVAAATFTTAAQAATKPVYMGLPNKAAGDQFKKLNGDANAFFPNDITVHVGDTVAFVPNGFHNLDLPAKGGKPTALLTPGATISGAKDAAGADFWFNGQPAMGFNPVLSDSGYGKSFTYDGTKAINSGLPLGPKLKPVEVKFTKKGTFTYYCSVHTGMKARVHVVGAKAKAPSKKSDAKRIAKQLRNDLASLKRLQKTKPGADTVQIGASAPGGVESFDFFPANPTVKVGTTLEFTMPVGSTETHTSTTGPGDPTDENSYLGAIAKSFEGPNPSPMGVYPSGVPGPETLSPTLHGNGFWNSGALDAVAASPPPMSNKVTFGAAGTYTFYCMIHPFMKATVTVTS